LLNLLHQTKGVSNENYTKLTKTLKSLVIAGAILTSSSLLAADGASIYKKCAGCHGSSAEKPALGKSKIIANMSEDELSKALNGYKDGTYGGPMKGLMKGQVGKYSDADLEAFAQTIGK